MERVIDTLVSSAPLISTILAVLCALAGTHWLLLGRRPEFKKEHKLTAQLVMLGLSVVGLVCITLALPVSEPTRNQIIGLIGLLASAVLAFSSTTLVANLMAGGMLRVTRAFRTGDFIRVENYFGRVAERGLLDTEIQTESRELVSIPNQYLVSHPVTVVRSSGTIVSCSLSLGYDVHHARVEALLIAAAAQTGLDDPFVQIQELGNYSVTYRVSGLLTSVKSMLTARSNLYKQILDSLHGAGVEIVSPTFMNQRQLPAEDRVIPQVATVRHEVHVAVVEEIAFDKADKAEEHERFRERTLSQIESLTQELKSAEGSDKQRIHVAIEALREGLAKGPS